MILVILIIMYATTVLKCIFDFQCEKSKTVPGKKKKSQYLKLGHISGSKYSQYSFWLTFFFTVQDPLPDTRWPHQPTLQPSKASGYRAAHLKTALQMNGLYYNQYI